MPGCAGLFVGVCGSGCPGLRVWVLRCAGLVVRVYGYAGLDGVRLYRSGRCTGVRVGMSGCVGLVVRACGSGYPGVRAWVSRCAGPGAWAWVLSVAS